MANDNVTTYDHATGETIVREMTDEEQSVRNAESAAYLAQQAQVEADKQAARAAAEAKLAALGLDADDLKALGLA